MLTPYWGSKRGENEEDSKVDPREKKSRHETKTYIELQTDTKVSFEVTLFTHCPKGKQHIASLKLLSTPVIINTKASVQKYAN